jgi:prevent-host-death family protein
VRVGALEIGIAFVQNVVGSAVIVTSYSEARGNLAFLMDRAVEDAEELHITRRGKPDVVLIAADELEG